MATPALAAAQATADTPIVVKVAIDGTNRKFKFPLKDLNASTLPKKINDDQEVIFERFSDSLGSFITLNTGNPATYKQLYRAAKAKLKLRLKVTVVKSEPATEPVLAAAAADKAPTSPETKISSVDKTATQPKPLPTVLQPEPSRSLPIRSSNSRNEFVDKTAAMPKAPETTRDNPAPTSYWQLYCNSCDKILPDAHFHCGICDQGDYDLCEACVNSGKLCYSDDHWLIKRSVKDGQVVTSTTEKVAPKTAKIEHVVDVPTTAVAATIATAPADVKVEETSDDAKRTCNCCVRESVIMNCVDCPDYDLCVPCSSQNRHGHHPGHKFKPVQAGVDSPAQYLPTSVRHFALCDKCNKSISDVRYKCLDCPDWDFCATCYDAAGSSHAGHRFAPIYDTLPTVSRSYAYPTHTSIFCDGPLCSDQSKQTYITGIRYKCAICHDTDFCANCEAHPSNKHNPTHPLIKFKNPIRGVSVQTVGDNGIGQALPMMGDKTAVPSGNSTPLSSQLSSTRNPSTETLPVYTPSATNGANNGAKPLLQTNEDFDGLNAHFVSDSVLDGTTVLPETFFHQTWVLRNPGPKPWPVGCYVGFVGGDYMLSVDRTKSVSVSDLEAAHSSNATDVAVSANGDEFRFTVQLRSPAREGRYISYWHMRTANGVPFGHKLWCDIQVTVKTGDDAATAASRSQPVCAPAFRRPAQQMRAMVRERERALRQAHRSVNTAAAAASKAWTAPPVVEASGDEKSMSLPSISESSETAKNDNAGVSQRDLALVEHLELKDLVEKQRKRRESTQVAHMDAEAKASIIQACAVADNQEARALIDRQEKRRQAVRSSLSLPPSSVPSSSSQSVPAMGTFPLGYSYDRNQPFVEVQQRARAAAQQQHARFEQWKTQMQLQNRQAVSGGQSSIPPPPMPRPMYEGSMASYRSSPFAQKVGHYYPASRQMLGRRTVDQFLNVPPPVPAKEPNTPLQTLQVPPSSNVESEAPKVPDEQPESTTASGKQPKRATVEDVEVSNPEETLSTSAMVFPKIERDGSPASSTHDESIKLTAAAAAGLTPPQRSPVLGATVPVEAETATTTEADETTTAGISDNDDEEFEDVSNAELYADLASPLSTNGVGLDDARHEQIESDEEEDDGFDTDEYDILDASDEEVIHEGLRK